MTEEKAGTSATLLDRLYSLWHAIGAWLIGAIFIIAASAILLFPIQQSSNEALDLGVGDVAPVDITAPRSINYISEIQTAQAREAAADAVSALYDPADTRIARQQVTRAQAALNFINSVRADTYASEEKKKEELSYLTDLTLSEETMDALLALDDISWRAIQAEVPRVIEEVMSAQLREDQISEARRRIPGLVSVALDLDEAAIVTELAGQYVVPNSLFNDAATEAAREAARQSIEPITQSFIQGQTIVSRGNVITQLDIEAFQALDLLQPEEESFEQYLPPLLAVLIFVVILVLYLNRYHPVYFVRLRYLVFLSSVLLAFLFGAQLMLPDRTVLPFLFPAAALGMLIAVGLGPRLGLVITLLFSIFLAVIVTDRLDIVLYLAIGTMVAILTLGNAERVTNYFRAGLAAALANALMILILTLPLTELDLIGLATLLGASVANGALSASLTLTGFFLLGTIFDITTALQLVDLARPNHRLLQELLLLAPGTYQHSLQVANLAEQAAQRIGANALLVRVAALYHDVGKMKRPEYFVENQIEGENPHDLLDPYTSAQVIIDHVRDGEDMARKYRLPSAIRAAILEHHGTTYTMYQYRKAVKAAGGDESQVDISLFQYPGPKPQSRETALLMLADGCEAKVRADTPRNVEEIDEIVRQIFNARIQQGQLNECELTLADIQAVRESFVNTLRGFFHARLKYPEAKPEALAEGLSEKPAELEEATSNAPSLPPAAQA